MSLRIWETDPDSKPKPRNKFAEDLVGRFHGGMLIGRRPQALSEWRVTTDDPDVGDRIAELFGGTPEKWDTDRDNDTQVLTTSASVSIIIADGGALRTRMAQYGQSGPIHVCDGAFFISGHPEEDVVGDPCGCPRDLATRKEKAKAGTGPKPDIKLRFKLADDPELGEFLYSTSSWTLVNDLEEIEAALSGEGPFAAELSLVLVEYDTRAGKHVEYTRPVIDVKGPAAA